MAKLDYLIILVLVLVTVSFTIYVKRDGLAGSRLGQTSAAGTKKRQGVIVDYQDTGSDEIRSDNPGTDSAPAKSRTAAAVPSGSAVDDSTGSLFQKLASETDNERAVGIDENGKYRYPDFYRGIYLTSPTSSNFKRCKSYVDKAAAAHFNTLVMDVQLGTRPVIPSAKILSYARKNNMHLIARVVVFQDGLRTWPVAEKTIRQRIDTSVKAAKAGFKEIQFDYIRFEDSNRLRRVSLKQRYAFIAGFLKLARKRLKPYKVRTAADVFGRIPLNQNDLIGQRMEVLDPIVDVICPMAYPSHYTWSKKLQYNPYYTVKLTSAAAKRRSKHARVVTYIQAFRFRIGRMPYAKYIRDQIRAVYDAKADGFIFWNAGQKYATSLAVNRRYHQNKKVAFKD